MIPRLTPDLAAVQVAGVGLAADFGDVLMRGHLKGHPDLIAYRIGLVSGSAAQVRAAVARERAAGTWPAPAGDPVAEHEADTAAYLAHRCSCPFCPHGH